MTAVLGHLGFINLILAIFNLVPAFPLDGGRVLRALLWGWKNDLRWATRISSTIGMGFGGVLIGLTIGKLNPFIGFIAGIKAFTAAVLGGIGSIPGAMLGGVLLGLAETFASGYMPAEYKDVVAFGLLVLVLLFRPTGLLGKPDVEKV